MLKREKIISKIEEETHNVDGNIRKNGPEYEWEIQNSWQVGKGVSRRALY